MYSIYWETLEYVHITMQARDAYMTVFEFNDCDCVQFFDCAIKCQVVGLLLKLISVQYCSIGLS